MASASLLGIELTLAVLGLTCTGSWAQQPSIGDVRLVGGTTTAGRLEIYYNHNWGTVCDDGFDSRAAKVACRSLRLNGTAYAMAEAGFGEGAASSSIHLDEVVCSGSETDLSQCRHDPWDINDCDHDEDVGVVCQSGNISFRLSPVDGFTGTTFGKLQVLLQGVWGDICPESMDRNAAKVVCRTLGLPTAYPIIRTTTVAGNIAWMDGVLRCTGNETNLLDCGIGAFARNSLCYEGDPVTINCSATIPTLPVRLAGGNADTEGRVEVQTGGTWGTVCDDNWSDQDAAVVCHMLGFNSQYARATTGDVFGEGTGDIKFDEVQCTGTETSLMECRKDLTNDCDHTEDAGVFCGGAPSPTRIRLVGTARPYEGRVEVYHAGQWGTMCDDTVDVRVAKVVCREIGYPSQNPVIRGEAAYGEGRGRIWLDDMRCTGLEDHLDNCTLGIWGNHDCDHSEDVGVVCRSSTLQCFHCDGVLDAVNCHGLVTCAAGESCMESVIDVNGVQRYSLGCQSKLLCDSLTSGSVKRAEPTRLKCCETNMCNNELLGHPTGNATEGPITNCDDRQGVDCNALRRLMDICSNDKSARVYCPKTCGHCQVN